MKKSDSITELATALNLAQQQMGGAVKDSKNPFFKSNYADLTSVIKAIKEPLINNGLSYLQFPITSAGGNGVGVETILMHKSGQWISNEYVMPLSKNDAQGAASCITYARRYALQSIVGLPTADDDGEASMMRGKPQEQAITLDGLANEDYSLEAKDAACAAAVEKHQELLDYIRAELAKSLDSNNPKADEYRIEAITAFKEIPEADQLAMWVAPSKHPSAFFTTLERKLLKGL